MDTPSALDLGARGSRHGEEYHKFTTETSSRGREGKKVQRYL